MMDLYSALVEGLFQGPILTMLVLTAVIFVYLAWCRVGIYTNLMCLGLFILTFTWMTGSLLFTGIIILSLWYGAFIELKKELSES
jgi:hypothetical protein